MDRPQSDLFASIQWHTPIKAIVLCKEGKGQKGTDGCLLGDLWTDYEDKGFNVGNTSSITFGTFSICVCLYT